jgi:phospholipid-binding lipoprotein MlaA
VKAASKRATWLLLLLSLLFLSACASNQAVVREEKNPDPWEGVNRKIYVFNDGVDRYFMRPVAKGYQAVVPDPMETGVSNFFGNLNDVRTALNNVLQLKLGDAASDTGRFLVNSTVGVVGIVDVASKMGLKKNNEDFGQTLGHWGVASGPYVMIPFLGPSTVRDGLALPVDFYTSPQTFLTEEVAIRNSLWALKFINQRAELLSLDVVLEDVAYDKYELLRNAYLSRREFLVTDGKSQQQQQDMIDELEQLEQLEMLE